MKKIVKLKDIPTYKICRGKKSYYKGLSKTKNKSACNIRVKTNHGLFWGVYKS